MSFREKTLLPFWTSVAYIRPVFEYLRQHQQPLQPCLELLGLTESDLTSFDAFFDDKHAGDLLDLAGRQCQEPDIGLRIGQQAQLQHLGTFGMLLLSGCSMRELLDLMVRFQHLVGNGIAYDYRIAAGELCITLTVPEGHIRFTRHQYEFNLFSLKRYAEQLIGDRVPLLRVEFPYEQPPEDSALFEVLDVPIQWNCDRARVYLPAEFADRKVMAAAPQLRQVLELAARRQARQIRDWLSGSPAELAEVQERIAERLAYGAPTIDQIAQDMHLSTRTLQRRLNELRQPFSKVLDRVRQELAMQYIQDPELSQFDIALILGFTQQTSFIRAFRRWYGISPGAYRTQIQDQIAEH